MLAAEERIQVSSENLIDRLQELETLSRIGQTVTAVLDLDEVLRAVVDSAVELTAAEEGSLLLLDEESGETRLGAEIPLCVAAPGTTIRGTCGAPTVTGTGKTTGTTTSGFVWCGWGALSLFPGLNAGGPFDVLRTGHGPPARAVEDT